MKEKYPAAGGPKAQTGEIGDGLENTPSYLFDGLDYQDPELAVLLAKSEPGPEVEGGIFDDILLEAGKAGGSDYVPQEDPAANPYREVFLTLDEDEKPLEEIIKDLASLDLGRDDLSDEAPAPPGGLTGGEAAGSGPDMGRVLTSAAAAAGAQAAAALAQKVKEKMAAEGGQQVNYWYYYRGGSQAGPVAEPELKDLLASGRLPPDTYVWREGLAGWVTAEQAALVTGGAGAASHPPGEQALKSPAKAGPKAGVCVWYCHLNGQTWGPVQEEELVNLFKSGRIDPGTYVWKEGMDNWITVESAGWAENAGRAGESPKSPKTCPACAKPAREGARYCTACGSKLP